jgi:hypothetical protein
MQEPAGTEESGMMDALLTLTLTATATGGSFAAGAAIPVRLRLVNSSPTPVQVNGRLGVGYEDEPDREIFFTVRDRHGRVLPVPDEVRVDAHRRPPGRNDFRSLNPGQGVTGEVNLALWYPFERPDDYLVTLHYENTDDGAAFGIDAVTGRFDSEALRLRITPRSGPSGGVGG